MIPKGENATTGEVTRQYNDDKNKDQLWALIGEYHDACQDEAEAQDGYSDLFEHDNPYFDDTQRALVRFVNDQEWVHEHIFMQVAKALRDGCPVTIDMEWLTEEYNRQFEALATAAGVEKVIIKGDA